jgi:Domain of unknown function (DUF6969)
VNETKRKGRTRSRSKKTSPAIDFAALDADRLRAMAEAGREVVECHRVVARTGDNIVGEVLRNQGTFREYDHCPAGDIFDPESHAQYYYHAHRPGEHGHFHTFLRERGMPRRVRPAKQSEADYMKEREDRISHLIAISMDPYGVPREMFTTNRWVTAENWYRAADVCTMVDRFEIDHAQPSWPANRWVTAMVRLFRPQIEMLLRQRDDAVAAWQKKHPDEDVFEDRGLDLPSSLAISVDDQIRNIELALDARG